MQRNCLQNSTLRSSGNSTNLHLHPSTWFQQAFCCVIPSSILPCPQVRIQQQKASFLHFLTNVCAIVGGVFAVSGLIDGTVYHAEQVIKKKMELGKHM